VSTKIEIPIDLPGVNDAIKEIQSLQTTLDGLKSLGITSGKAVEELETQIKSNTDAVKRHTDGLEALNKKNKDTEESTKKLDASAEGIADTFGKVFEVAGKVYEGLVRIGQAAGEAEKQAQALEGLGQAAHEVEVATNGMVSAQSAYQTQQALLRSGISLSSQDLATLTRGAREHAQALGIDTTEALSQLTEALQQGDVQGLQKFGISLQGNQTRSQALTTTLRQLSNEQRGNAVAARTTTEATTHFTASVSEAGNALALFVSQETGLAGLFNNLSSWLNEATRELTDFAQHRDDILRGGSERDTANLQAQARSSEAYTRAVARLRQAQREAGVQSQGNFAGADQLTLEQRNLLTFRINAAANSGDRETLSNVAEQIRQQVLVASTQTVTSQQQAVATRSQRLASANRTSVSRGSSQGGGSNSQVDLGIVSLGESLANSFAESFGEELDRQLQLQALNRSEIASRISQGLNTSQALRSGQTVSTSARNALVELSSSSLQTNLAINTSNLTNLQSQLQQPDNTTEQTLKIRQQIAQTTQEIARDEQLLIALFEREKQLNKETFDLRINQTNSEIATYNTAKETKLQGLRLTEQEQQTLQNRVKIVRELTELEQGYQDLISQARNEGLAAKTQEERNAALGREIQLQQQRQQVIAQRRAFEREDLRNNFGGQLSSKFRETLGANATFAERFGEITTNAFTNFADASGSALLAVIEGQKDFGTAMKEMLRSVLETLAKQALVESLKNIALGIGNLAIQNYPGAGLNFAAAAAWGAVGIAAGLGARALGPTTQTQASAGAQTQARAQPQRVQNSNGNSNGNSGNLVLNITVNGALTNQGVEHNIVRALNRAQTRGIVPRYSQ
jgi:hypothetical protein